MAETPVKNPGVVVLHNPQKKDHADPPPDAHGLCFANPARAAFIGGVGASKTCTLLNCAARAAEWKPFAYVYLMGPKGCVEDMEKGEYKHVDVTVLHDFPELSYFSSRPGRSLFIMDDVALSDLSRKKVPGGLSQQERCERLCGHVSSHHPGGLSVFVATQTFVNLPPAIRRLMSHWVLFCNRISRESIPLIAKGVMIEKQTMHKIFDWCTEHPYCFALITNQPDGRARVRIDGHRPVQGLM